MNEPGIFRSAIYFASAVAEYLASGCENVTFGEYAARLKVCEVCPLQRRGKCLVCGCRVETKAQWRSEACPAERWP
jgi:hypothetical protein